MKIALALILNLVSVTVMAANIRPIKETFEPAGVFPENKYVKVAVIQWAPRTAELVETTEAAQVIKDRNRYELEQQIRTAAGQGAKIIIASELSVVGYPDLPEMKDEDDNFQTREQILPYAETIPGPSTHYFGRLAIELGVFIQYGDVEIHDGALYNVAVAISPIGEIVARHRKVSLYEVETNYFTPGSHATTYETPAGLFGVLICADVYEYGLLEHYYSLGVHALALSTSWAEMNTGWRYFTQAAKYVNSHLLAANQPYFPDSGIINPNGSHQSRIRQSLHGIAYGYLPLKK